MNKQLKRGLTVSADVFSWTVFIGLGLVVLYFINWVFVSDQFIIPTDSMRPTLIPGDRIVVNKIIFGARIYKSYDFSQGRPLDSWRMPGLRKIRPNDVLVFNIPHGYGKGIEFQINHVFAKRCIGTPGDRVSIENGFYRNNRYDGPTGLRSEQQRLRSTPDSLFQPHVLRIGMSDGRWTLKEYGPLYVPARGDTLELCLSTYRFYKRVIEYETGKKLSVEGDRFLLDNSYLTHHILTENYYFAGGDNVSDSNDSRYWGFVPEEFIIGVAKRISYSRDRNTGKFRWNRLYRRIDKDLTD